MGTEDMEKSNKQGQVTIRMSPKKMVLVRQIWDTRPLTMALVLLSFYAVLPWFANGDNVILSLPSRDLVSTRNAGPAEGLQLVVDKTSAIRGAGSIYNKNSATKVYPLPESELERHAFLPSPVLKISEDPEHIWAVPKEDAATGKESKEDSAAG
jgi:hypothetical protein